MTILLYDLVGKDDRRFSPTCWRVKMALAHKGLPFETQATPFTAIKTIGDGFSKTVPVINDGGKLINESFEIASYLEATYPDKPSLFGGPGGEALTGFVNSWALTHLHMPLGAIIMCDVHDNCLEEDQAYFRESREARFGQPLETFNEGRADKLSRFRDGLTALRASLKNAPFVGGEAPLYADYIILGAFQWARTVCAEPLVEKDDPVWAYVDRLLDLHDGLAREAKAHPW
ncbi:MAG: glutathione S-transferase family protein [Geminicoccaceae bacterium]